MWNIQGAVSITISYHCVRATSISVNLDNYKRKNNSLAVDLGKVQLQGVVQHHIESLEHVIVSSLSPRQDSAAEVMRLELGETFEIKRSYLFFLQSLCSDHGGKQNNVLTFNNMYCLMCLDLSITFFVVFFFFGSEGLLNTSYIFFE